MRFVSLLVAALLSAPTLAVAADVSAALVAKVVAAYGGRSSLERARVVRQEGGTIIRLEDVATVARRRPVILVHGGGKRITEWLERLGVPSLDGLGPVGGMERYVWEITRELAALAMLKETKKENDVRVDVTGEKHGDTIKVAGTCAGVVVPRLPRTAPDRQRVYAQRAARSCLAHHGPGE